MTCACLRPITVSPRDGAFERRRVLSGGGVAEGFLYGGRKPAREDVPVSACTNLRTAESTYAQPRRRRFRSTPGTHGIQQFGAGVLGQLTNAAIEAIDRCTPLEVGMNDNLRTDAAVVRLDFRCPRLHDGFGYTGRSERFRLCC